MKSVKLNEISASVLVKMLTRRAVSADRVVRNGLERIALSETNGPH